MKTGRIALAVGVIVAGTALARVAFAQPAFPTVTRNFNAWMARAMDPCAPSGLTVQGTPAGACVAANVTTDDQMTMNFARIVVNRRTAKVLVYGRGLIPGSRVLAQLTLRVTKNNQTVKHPSGSGKRVTFSDVTIQCPNGPPFGFVVRPSGTLLGSDLLANCLGAQSNLAFGNVEIMEAALLNHDNGDLVFARPGILR